LRRNKEIVTVLVLSINFYYHVVTPLFVGNIKEIKPWGVNVPYMILAVIYWTIGGFSLTASPSDHPYFMLLGAYSLFFGMIQRLFFPATKYFALQILTLILLSIPISYFQVLASISLTLTEIWALKDVMTYGGKFPVNLLVLSSPFLSVIAWSLYPQFWVLILPLLTYSLGVNIGVFTATLRTKPVFGRDQLPLLFFLILSVIIRPLYYFVGVIYLLMIVRTRYKMNLSASVTLFSVFVTPLLALFLGDTLHSFFLGVMAPLFFSCIVYSTSKYNYDYVWFPVLTSFLSYLIRGISIELSGIVWAISLLSFLYLVKDNFSLTTLKTGLSSRYLRRR
jgi:hypothetical protein